MEAWDILYNNSTLDIGDAWDHLNNQNAGTGTGEVIYVNSGGGGGGGTVYVDKKLPTVRILKVNKSNDELINININDIKEE